MAILETSVISAIIPPGVLSAEVEDRGQALALHPEEAVYVANAADSRRRDFAAGRFCARSALSRLGLSDVVIPRSAGGRPLWPDDVVGSITHTGGYAAAIVARKSEFLGLGVDAERVGLLGDDLFPLLFGPPEKAWLMTLDAAARAIAATSLFSAKEAYFKVWNPLTDQKLSLKALHVDLSEGGFVVTQPDATLEQWRKPVHGRLIMRGDLVVTTVCLPRPLS